MSHPEDALKVDEELLRRKVALLVSDTLVRVEKDGCDNEECTNPAHCLYREVRRLQAANERLREENEGLRAFEALGPGVNYTIADFSGYENTHWIWHETIHGGDGLIYAAKSLLEACQMFEKKEGGVDHP